jgi:hypothetical protein
LHLARSKQYGRDMNDNIKAGDKVRASPTSVVGTVVAVHRMGAENSVWEALEVAYPVKGRMYPVTRLEFPGEVYKVQP